MPLPILILDGGLGTTLEQAPFNIDYTGSALWSARLLQSDPSTLRAAHRAFVDAGADIILAATYQASLDGFIRDSQTSRENAIKYMRSAIPLARSAFESSKPPRVALSLGPYGATLPDAAGEYTGEYPEFMSSEAALRIWHTDRLKLFVADPSSWDGVEYLAFETIKRPDEVRVIRGAAHDLAASGTQKPWWITGVFPGDQVHEADVRAWVNAAIGDCADLPRPWGIGINCTRIKNIRRILAIMQDELRNMIDRNGFVDEWSTTSGRPWLIVYPDGTQGEEYDPHERRWVKTHCGSLDSWDGLLANIVTDIQPGDWEGVVVGGCCRTGPAQVAALRRRLTLSGHV